MCHTTHLCISLCHWIWTEQFDSLTWPFSESFHHLSYLAVGLPIRNAPSTHITITILHAECWSHFSIVVLFCQNQGTHWVHVTNVCPKHVCTIHFKVNFLNSLRRQAVEQYKLKHNTEVRPTLSMQYCNSDVSAGCIPYRQSDCSR